MKSEDDFPLWFWVIYYFFVCLLASGLGCGLLWLFSGTARGEEKEPSYFAVKFVRQFPQTPGQRSAKSLISQMMAQQEASDFLRRSGADICANQGDHICCASFIKNKKGEYLKTSEPPICPYRDRGKK